MRRLAPPTLMAIVGLLGVVSASGNAAEPMPKTSGARFDSNNTAPSAAPKTEELLDLRLRFVPGRELLYAVTTEKVVTQEGAEKTPYRSRTLYLLRSKVQSVSRSLPVEATLQFQFDQVQWTSVGAEEKSFDSNAPPSPDEPPLFASARTMIGKPFVVAMNDRAEILTLRAVDVRHSDEQRNADTMQLVGESQLRGLLTSFYSWFPADVVAPQQSWSRSEELPFGFMTLERRNTVKVVGGTYARPRIESQIEVFEKPHEGMIQGEMHILGHLTVSRPKGKDSTASEPNRAVIVFNREQGVLEAIDANVRFDMALESKSTTKKRAKSNVLRQTMQAATRVQLRAVDGMPNPLAN